MASLKEADFFYGAALSALFNKGFSPSIVEGGVDRQIYDVMTDEGQYRLYIKYRSFHREGKDGYKSWQFNFNNDYYPIERFIEDGYKLFVILVCGCETLTESELVVLSSENIMKVFDNQKYTLTISRSKGEKAYRLPIGGGRSNSIKIPTNTLLE